MKRNRSLISSALALTTVAVVVSSGCGGSGSSAPTSTSSPTTATPTTPASSTGTDQVLPVNADPISNKATAPGLVVTKALVENNVSAETGKAVADHLEVELKNSSGKAMTHLELYYSITDRAKGISEGYFTKLDGLILPPGATHVVHFDNAGTPDHYPANRYSLYFTDKNALVVTVIASSIGFRVATFTVKKDAGGAEAGVE